MTNFNPFSCFIIGETTLLTQCAESLLERGHTIHGIVSQDKHVLRWNRNNGILSMESSGDLLAFLRQHPFDYLFSIVNPLLLPNAILQLPRQKAINYHDAPLPRYAGLYATSWALLNQEKTHGITWHVMTEQLDAGNILKQVLVDIDPDETAFSLNMKCYSAAIRGFGELVDELAEDRVAPQAQDLSQRTYFPIHKRPSPGCLLSWTWDADYLDCFVRALDFDRYLNPLGCPKMVIGSECLIIRKLEVLPAASDAPAGTIVAVTPEAIRVTTGTADVAVGEILTQDGQPIEVSHLVDRFGVVEGSCLEPLDAARMLILEAQTEALSKHESYWLRRLSGIIPLRLPSGASIQEKRERAPRRTLSCSSSEIIAGLPETKWPRAKEHVLLAAHLAFFFRLRERAMGDVGLVSETILNRLPGLEFLFSPVVPLRVEWNPQQTLLDYVGSVSEACLRTQERAPFLRDLTVRCPEIKSAIHNHLGEMFSITFVIGKRDFVLDTGASVRPSELSVALSDHGTEYHWQYDPGAVASDDVERMHQQFQAFLMHAVAEPDRTVATIPMLTDRERHQLLREWTATATTYPRETTLAARFEAQVTATPDAVAVVFEERQLTYSKLNTRANQLAHYLKRFGVGPEVPVGVCMERSLETVIGLLGILKAGGIYVPLDPTYPDDQLDYRLRNLKADILLTKVGFKKRLSSLVSQLVCLDSDEMVWAHFSVTNPAFGVSSRNSAYVIYTSGSTGKPKGVLISHGSIVNHSLVVQKHYGLHAKDRVLQFASLTFDASLEQILPTLITGGTLVLWDRDVGSLDDLPKKMALSRVTVADFPTSYWHVLAHNTHHLTALAGNAELRLCIVGGEKMLPHALTSWQEMISPKVRLLNAYGPTETTVTATTFEIPPKYNQTDVSQGIPIGSPLPSRRCYVVDPYGNPVPWGVLGELFIGGLGVAEGYLNSPAMTAEKFVPDPFNSKPGSRLYKTGDQVRYDRNGALSFLGRLDCQVKIRGFRIELGEIEAVLVQHPAVAESVALVREDEPGDKRLVAYVVQAKETLSSSDLRSFLRRQLPDHMVPAIFVMLDALPLTPNGKVDRRALPAPEGARPELESAYQAPQGPIEEALAGIWSELLRIDQVGRHDNFFELGGDSILSIQIVAKASQTGLRVTPRHIFQHQTIAGLAEAVEVLEPVTADQGIVSGSLPLSPVQHWFWDHQFEESRHWNMAWVLEARPSVDPEKLEQVVDALLRHHDALRLRFVQRRSGWTQQVNEPDQQVPFSFIDLSHLQSPEAEAAYKQEADRMHASLDLSEGPLIRVALFRFGESQADRVLIVIHHLVVDGVSWRILLDDLQTAYDQLNAGEAIELPPKTTSFKAWTERLVEYARSDALNDEVEHWLAVADEPWTPLPRDFPNGVNTVASTRTVVVELEREDTQALLQEIPEVYHTQINDVLLTALVDVLTQWTQQEAVCLHLEGHGREALFEDVDLSRTVGWFTTNFPVVLQRGHPAHPGDLLKSVKEQLRQIPNRGIGYGLLRYLSDDEGVLERFRESPVPEVAFNYLGQFDQVMPSEGQWAWSEASVGALRHPQGKQPELITLDSRVIDGVLQVHWTYGEAVHRRETIERLANDYLTSLVATIRHCQSPGAGGYTPSDFALAEVSQADLDKISQHGAAQGGSRIADLYPLAPLQQGLWFHDLLDPAAGAYFDRHVMRIEGLLKRDAFRRAWEAVVARHAILRTRVVWEGLEHPLQLVQPKVELPWAEEDWRGNPADEHQTRLWDFLAADRVRGLDLARAPMMRLTLLRVAEHSAILVWSFHHLILDRWSFDLVLQEVWSAYEALVDERAPRFRSLHPYRDYLQWLQSQDLNQAAQFWRLLLAGFSEPTVLGIDQAPGTRAEHREDCFDFQEVILSENATTRLSQWARQQKLTVNTLLQGAWSLLLSRYSATEDVVFGATASGRSARLSGIESMVGLFINTLPVRVQVTPGETLVEWLNAIQEQQVMLREYEYTPLFEIQKWSEVPAGEPLFDTLLVFENTPLEDEDYRTTKAAGLDVQPVADGRGDLTNYPLALAVVPGRALHLRFTYDTRHYRAEAVQRMIGHVQRVLAGMVEGTGQQRLADIPLLTDTERQQLLVDWNGTRQKYPTEEGIHERFEAQVAATPDAVAVVFGEDTLTYAELNARANCLANHLRKQGIGPEDVVGVLLPRSIDLIIGLLGIVKADGAYLPIDPTLPSDRIAFMVTDVQASIVLTHASLTTLLPAASLKVVCLDAEVDRLTTLNEANLLPRVEPSNLAYVIYTSGSTGTPKGVAITHSNLLNLVSWHQQTFEVVPSDRATQIAGLSFDAAVWELWPYLLNGASVVLAPEEEVRTVPEKLRDWLVAEQITISFLPTPLAESVLSLSWPAHTSLRIMLTGGDQLHQYPAPMLPFRLVNNYGPTENTVVTTSGFTEPFPPENKVAPSIGRPIANTQVYVLDGTMQPLPVGVYGELYIGGQGLARNYLRRPALTAEKFVPHPFSPDPGGRLYRTGDLVRYRSDRTLEFKGRQDDQVKVRGYRIELGEIEAALSQHPDVQEAVVVVREEPQGVKRLVGYVVPAEEPLSPGELRQFLKQTLPEYMLPAIFMKLDALPLTSSGKVDRRALPVPESSQLQLETEFVAPLSPYEEAVAEIWRDSLGLEQVGIHDNFFDLGGHSLLAAKILSRLKTTFAVDIPLRAFFDSPTIAGVSATLAIARRGEDPTEKSGILPVARNGTFPLSFAQERFWVLDQFHTDRAVYNGPADFRLRGTFQLEVFEKSVQALVDRHEILRTTFASAEGGPHQVIAPSLSVRVPLQNCSGLSKEERVGMIQQAFLEEKRFQFDLVHGPLFRARLLRFAEDDHFLVLNLHHIIHDAWSLEVIIKDLVAAYSAGCAGQAVTLPVLPIQYVDYAHWQRELLEGPIGREQLAFWKKQLADLPPALPLPTDYSRPAVQTFRGAREDLRLPAELSAPLRALNRQEGTTLFMVMLATLQYHLHRLSGTTDILVGSPIAGRDQQEIQGLIGCFLNTLVLRTDLSGDLTGRDLLQRVREVVLNAYENQDVPFEKILAEVHPVRDLSRTPVFQVMLNMHSFDDQSLPLPGLSVTRIPSADINSLFDMTLYFQESTDEILMTLVYNADLFTAGRMTEFMRQYQCILEQMIHDPDRPLGALSLVTPSARLYLPDPQQPLDAQWQAPVWSRLEHHAQQRGEAIAITSPGATWTYQDLEARSNRLAHYLLEQGVEVQDVVAIYAARSSELVLALLGVLKAGVAFMVLDPAHPSSRLLEMLEIAKPRGLIHLDEAGPLPNEVDNWAASVSCRVRLPAFGAGGTDGVESRDGIPDTAPQVEIRPDDLAYVTFTSGSTGTPRCLQGTHRPLSHFVSWYSDALQLTAVDRVTMFSGLAHDPLLRDVFTPLWVGGTLCIPDEEALASGRVSEWMNEQQVTLSHLTPSLADVLSAGFDPANGECTSLRYAVFGGDSLRPSHVECIGQLAPQARCINAYGATETPQIMGWHVVPPELPSNVEQVPIGQGIDGVQVLLLNQTGQPAGIGELGEIYVRTPYLTRGYVNDETLTSARFLPNPFRREAGDRIYRTGDMGRWAPNGNIEFVGRSDSQVKIRGFRIEVGEVEAALVQHPLVLKAVVVRRDDGPAGPHLVGYLQTDQDTAVSPDALRSFLRERLPEYMVPSAWMELDAFPLTPNGKIDRMALPRPDAKRGNLDVEFVAPGTPTEIAVAAIWQEVLGLDRVGVHDNFFDLGGHSLLATQVVARVRESLGIDLGLRHFFEVPTLKALAGTVELLRHSTEAPGNLEHDAGDDRSEFVL